MLQGVGLHPDGPPLIAQKRLGVPTDMIRAKLIVIGLACLASSVGMYAAYLTFSREIREYVFLDPKCLSGWINAAVDNLFELSVLSSLFLVFASVSRWLLIPWLIVYAVDILVMVALTIASLLVPLNNPQFPGRFTHIIYPCMER